MHKMNRRSFLKCSALTAIALVPGLPFACPSQRAFAKLATDNYYPAHAQELIADFTATLQGAVQFLAPELGKNRAQAITGQALDRFKALLPNLPEVGGDYNPDTPFIPIAAWYVALYDPLRSAGKSARDVGKLIYDLNVMSLGQMPAEQAKAEQRRYFSEDNRSDLHSWTVWTLRRDYPGNWVADFIPGDGKEFDFGIDYHECGVVKYFQAQGVSELAPYFCLNDFPRSRTLGTGLVRTKTIANGDGICNFRYKQDRPVTQDWASEIGGIRERRL